MSRLLGRVREAIRVRPYGIRTEVAYLNWIRQFIHFHETRQLIEQGEPAVNAFRTHLAVEREVAASTRNQALGALLLDEQLLERLLKESGEVVRARRPKRLPVVLTREAVRVVGWAWWTSHQEHPTQ